MGFNSFVNIPDLTTATRKRKVTDLTDPTQNYNYNTSVPTDLPVTGGMPVGGAMAPTGNSKMDILSNIMQALASGYAVSQSDNPAQTIMQQMMQRRQEAMTREQQQYELLKQQNEQTFRKQTQATEITARKEEQATDIAARKEAQQSQQTHEINRDDVRFKNNLALQKDDQLARVAALKLTQDFEAGEAQKNRELQLDLQDARDRGDIKTVQVKTFMAAMLNASKYHNAAPASRVIAITDKMINNQALTKEDFRDIDTSMKINAATSGGVAGIGGKFQQRSYLQLQKERADFVKYLAEHPPEEPRINPQTGMPMYKLNGDILMKPVDADTYSQTVKERLKIFDTVTGFHMQGEKAAVAEGVPQIDPAIIVNNLVNLGQSPNQINQAIENSKMSTADKKRARQQITSHFKDFITSKKNPNKNDFLNYNFNQ